MTSQRKPAVVVGVDGSATALHAVGWAAERANRAGLPLRLLHAYHLPLGFPSGVTEEESILNVLRGEGRRWLGEARDLATMVVPGLDVESELVAMPTTTGLVRESDHASVLVLGNRGHNALTNVLLGSTSLALASHANCPVVLVRNGADGAPSGNGPVVVGVDGTQVSEAAVAFAFAEAAAAGATLVAVHAYGESVFDAALIDGGADAMTVDWQRQRELAEASLGERLAGWQEKYPEVHVEREVVHDRPTRALRRCARTARLVVVGRRGRGGFRDLVLGSTSQQLLHHAPCPVAVVRTETPE